MSLLNQLLDFRKTETEGYKLKFTQKDIIPLLFDDFYRFKGYAEKNNLKFNISTTIDHLNVSFDEDAFNKILSNLLINSIKYADTFIDVSLNYSKGDKFFTIDVKNDGKEIPDTIKDKIFEPFFRGENSEFKPGSGLGLPLARTLAEMHKGSLIYVDTEDTDIITFRLKLPVYQEEINKKDEITNEDDKPLADSSTEYIYDNSRQTILVVEDNEEMQSFIGNEINSDYNVLVAANGNEAINILNNNTVQLIVSDVMMPEMDGFQFLEKIKSDLNFSHVPVILLTAKNTLQSRLEGLELGADAYIEKPFSVNILLAQITNLINNRENIRTYYFNSPIANLKSIAHTKADEVFLEKLNDIIIDNISNTRLDVEMLAEKLNMSKPTFYRKIKAVSDLTPNDLIRTCRLKKAAEFITDGTLSLSEIAENVGFSSQSYFSRSFSKQFGMSPTEYASEIKQNN